VFFLLGRFLFGFFFTTYGAPELLFPFPFQVMDALSSQKKVLVLKRDVALPLFFPASFLTLLSPQFIVAMDSPDPL